VGARPGGLDAAVVKRIPLRYGDEDRYFPNDTYQVLPWDGYTQAFNVILDHPRITVLLNTRFEPSMPAGHAHCFNSMPIDEFFQFDEGAVP
jgi:UDP-galactopyranose mutase